MIEFIYVIWIISVSCIVLSFIFIFLNPKIEDPKNTFDFVMDTLGAIFFGIGLLLLLVVSVLSSIDLFFAIWGIHLILGYVGLAIIFLTHSLIVATISIRIADM